MTSLTLDEITDKATAYAEHMTSPEGQQTAIQIIAANLRDLRDSRAPSSATPTPAPDSPPERTDHAPTPGQRVAYDDGRGILWVNVRPNGLCDFTFSIKLSDGRLVGSRLHEGLTPQQARRMADGIARALVSPEAAPAPSATPGTARDRPRTDRQKIERLVNAYGRAVERHGFGSRLTVPYRAALISATLSPPPHVCSDACRVESHSHLGAGSRKP